MKKLRKSFIGLLACLTVFFATGCEALQPADDTPKDDVPPTTEPSTPQEPTPSVKLEEKEIVIVDDETDVERFAATTSRGVTPTISYKANYMGVNGVAEILSKNVNTNEVKKYGGFVFLSLNSADALEIYNHYKADPANFTLKLNLYVRVVETDKIMDTKATLSGIFNNIRNFEMNTWQEFSVSGADITGWTSAETAMQTLTGEKEFFYIQHAWESATVSNTNVESDIYIYVDSITYTIAVNE